MSSNIIAKTRKEWEALGKDGDKYGIRFLNNSAIFKERLKQRYPLAFSQKDMQDIFIEAYQKLADYLGETVYATGSVLRGYWRTKEEEDEIAKKFDIEPKYSDFDFYLTRKIEKEEIIKINKDLNPICPYSHATWERSIEFVPKNKIKNES